jgi:signal peptidase I
MLAAPIALFLAVRALVAEPFQIPSTSMAPTLRAGEHVIANKLVYRVQEPRVGDVVILEDPRGDGLLAKRIVATGGQRVEIRDGVLHIDRRPRRESYVDYDMVDGFYFGPARVPRGAYFVMGDDRGDSEDSRAFGPVARDKLIGRADLRVGALSRIAAL